MAVFEYQAIDLDRSALGGTIVADTLRRARDQLRDRGLTVMEIREAVRGPGSGILASRREHERILAQCICNLM